jgi:hypothetical protein
MTDRSTQLIAWSVAAVVILGAIGTYLVYERRSRAVMAARSLSASGHAANLPASPVTRTLHVEGCNKDFLVKVGELVEPRVVPDAPLDAFRSVYGKEDKRTSGILAWDKNAFLLTEDQPGPASSGQGIPGDSLHLDLDQGHVVETLDGIDLGIDTFAAIFHKMRDRQAEIRERLDHSGGKWTLIVSVYSDCGHKYRSEYSRTLDATPELDKLIAPRPAVPGSQTPPSGLPRSDVFMNKIATGFTMTPSNGQIESPKGTPSEHD